MAQPPVSVARPSPPKSPPRTPSPDDAVRARAAADAVPARTSAPAHPDAAERQRMIAEAAYFRARQRDFAPGGELEDWLSAELEIDALLRTDGAH